MGLEELCVNIVDDLVLKFGFFLCGEYLELELVVLLAETCGVCALFFMFEDVHINTFIIWKWSFQLKYILSENCRAFNGDWIQIFNFDINDGKTKQG